MYFAQQSFRKPPDFDRVKALLTLHAGIAYYVGTLRTQLAHHSFCMTKYTADPGTGELPTPARSPSIYDEPLHFSDLNRPGPAPHRLTISYIYGDDLRMCIRKSPGHLDNLFSSRTI